MYKKTIIILSIGVLCSCGKQDLKQEKLYVELKKNHEYFKKAQNRIDTNLKKTEDDLLKVRADVQKEVGYFSSQYQELDENMKKFISNLEDKAVSHQELLLEQSLLVDEILNERMKYEEALQKKRMIERKRQELERSFEISLSSQDTLLNKAQKLLNNHS